MIRTILTILFVCLLSLTAAAQSNEEEWRAAAIEKYPALAVEGSDFNKRFLDAFTDRQRTDPGFFTIPKWPLLLADDVAKQLAQPEPKPEPGAPEQKPPTAAPVADVQGSTLWPALLSLLQSISLPDPTVSRDLISRWLVNAASVGAVLVLVVAIITTALRRRSQNLLERQFHRGASPALKADEAAGPRMPVEEVIWIGHASLWDYFWRWFFGLLLFAIGIGVVIILRILIDQGRRIYLVTNRKVIFQFGLLAKNTNELRIRDIRSINVAKTGFGGLMGIGNVQFATVITEEPEIVFSGIPDADKVRRVVGRIQDEAG